MNALQKKRLPTLNAAQRKAAPNPLRFDPSRLMSLRRSFFAELGRRFASLKKSIALHVTGIPTETLDSLERWLDAEMDRELVNQPWWRPYIATAYQRGAARSYDDIRPFLASTPDDRIRHDVLRDDFLTRLLRGDPQPVPVVNAAIDRLRDAEGKFIGERAFLLGKRLENEMEGVTTLMSQKMGRVLIQAQEQGWTRAKTARELNAVVDLGKTRAQLVARTELQRAHAEGQLDTMEVLGVEEIEAEVEWKLGTAKPCPQCLMLAGKVYKVSEARGLIPLHPNCGCRWSAIKKKPKVKPSPAARPRRRLAAPPPVPPAAIPEPVIQPVARVPKPVAPLVGPLASKPVPVRPAAAAAAAPVSEAQAWQTARSTLASLQSQRQALGGLVAVPEVVDSLVAQGMTREQAHTLLLKWADEDRIVLRVSNDPTLAPRGTEFIKSPRGWLGFIRLL